MTSGNTAASLIRVIGYCTFFRGEGMLQGRLDQPVNRDAAYVTINFFATVLSKLIGVIAAAQQRLLPRLSSAGDG